MKNQNTNLIQTKFFKPKIPSDFIRKDTLLKRLDQCIEFPLTMVSAPAGYGKSLLVSDWLDAQPNKNAWREFHLPNQRIPMGENDHNYDLDYHVKESRLNFHDNPYTGIINFLLNEKELTF